MFRANGLTPPLRALAALLALATLVVGCSQPDFGPSFPQDAKALEAESFECCFDPEKFYPAPVAKLVTTLGNQFGVKVSELAYSDFEESSYPGKLTGKAEAEAAILARLRPLDILIIGNTSHLLGRLMPGRFSHAVIYVGTEAEMRAAGYWHLPEVVPHHDDIRAGKTMIQGVSPAVELTSPGDAFEVDRVLAMRPRLSPAERRDAMRHVFSQMGAPFNFGLSIDPNNERFVCTGLIDYAMPSVGLTRRVVYDVPTILPDDIAAQAIRGEGLDIVAYVLGNDGPGFEFRSRYALMVDIAAYWGIPGTPSAPRSQR